MLKVIYISFHSISEEVTNVQLHPSFLFNNNNNNNTNTSRMKRVIGNFQRNVYTPTTYNSVKEMFSGEVTNDTIPVLLRDLHQDEEEGFDGKVLTVNTFTIGLGHIEWLL